MMKQKTNHTYIQKGIEDLQKGKILFFPLLPSASTLAFCGSLPGGMIEIFIPEGFVLLAVLPELVVVVFH